MVARYGYVSTHQIAKRFFGNNKQSSQLADTMRKLFDAGYIDRFAQPSNSTVMKNMPLISVLTKKGAEFVAESQGIDISKLQIHSAADQPKAAYFEHLLSVNDVRVIFELACEQNNYDLKWLDERIIRKNKLYVELVQCSQQEVPAKIVNIPDSVLCIKTMAGWLSDFLEI
ncbi:replication-relaxation family protein, partial [Candidatus Dojkabacteria bacterium]|nr:replication-relaxation family protein [Candidatus Dojkabacteria bacterium]